MSTEPALEECLDAAAAAVGSVWPLHSFVTANPLAGFEDRPFHEAVAEAEDRLGADGYPAPSVFRQADDEGRIDTDRLTAELAAHGYETDPEASLAAMAEPTTRRSPDPATERVDTVLSKWLAAFLDEGRASWSMPNREDGFYDAFRSVAAHDGEVPDGAVADLPDEPADAIRDALAAHPTDEWRAIFEAQLAALPGWTGLLKRRAANEGVWQSAYPITLTGYLAARLALVEAFDAPLAPDDADTEQTVPRAACWLSAWEESYRDRLVEPITEASAAREADDGRPAAQLVFCIDTRSEIIRRHVEAAGDYETHGYAGFFGVLMRYSGYDSSVTVDACPPIVDAEHYVTEQPTDTETRKRRDRWAGLLEAGTTAIKDLRSNAATAFSYVESTGVGYAGALAARTLVPGRVRSLLDSADRGPDDHEFCGPTVDHDPEAGGDLPAGMTLEERVEYAATAFELMGIEQFGRLFVFAGHASETANNPFDSSLDCGACAGNPGGPSARVLATICNDGAVRERLAERGIEVPADTVFLAGQHNTTTDEIDIYGDVPASHADELARLRDDLDTARANAAAERAGDMGVDGDGVAETERRAADWAQPRPEWGLAGNAAFVIGPRELTDGLDLDGRVFLHSYDYQTDPDGEALGAIVAGPMVVTQWINNQYYFATVDNAAFGSGSKITHNPVGNVGVYQGNGGDIMTGLPLQSLTAGDDEPYHQPIRLSAVIHAPVERVTEVLREHGAVAELLDNDWLSLTVVDPTQDHTAFEYERDLAWTPLSASAPEQTPELAAEDD